MSAKLNGKAVKIILSDYLADYDGATFVLNYSPREFIVTTTFRNTKTSFLLRYENATEEMLVQKIKANLNFTPHN